MHLCTVDEARLSVASILASMHYAENVTGQDVVSLQVHDPDLDMNEEVQFMLTCIDKFGADCDGEWFVCACGQHVLLL